MTVVTPTPTDRPGSRPAERQPAERWHPERWRGAFRALSAEPGAWLAGSEGAAWIEQVTRCFARRLCDQFRFDAKWGYQFEPAEVVSIIITRIAGQPSVAEALIRAENPVGYLAVCTERWMQLEAGVRGSSFEVLEGFVPADPRALTQLEANANLESAIELTVQVLQERTPQAFHPAVGAAVSWLAYNPPSRMSYTSDELVWLRREMRVFTMLQLRAIANVVWGGRPRAAETSVIGQFLRDSSWRPSSSATHSRALRVFTTRMFADTPAELLSEDRARIA